MELIKEIAISTIFSLVLLVIMTVTYMHNKSYMPRRTAVLVNVLGLWAVLGLLIYIGLYTGR